MSGITRRNLLSSGLALSASALAASRGWSTPCVLAGDESKSELVTSQNPSPRELLLFDFGWKFTLGHASAPSRDLGFGLGHGIFGDFAKAGYFAFAKTGYDDSKWQQVNLPHDWAIDLPYVNDEHLRYSGYKPLGRNYPETSIGWYRREFDMRAEDRGRRVVLEVEGLSRSALFFINGCYIGRHDEGYTPSAIDITDYLHYGGRNAIAVRVSAEMSEGWYYEGAGLYRHMWLLKTDALHLVRWESTIRTQLEGDTARLNLVAMVHNASAYEQNASVRWKIFNAAGAQVATAETPIQSLPANGRAALAASAQIMHPALWSPDTPHLYTAFVSIVHDGRLHDREQITFGIRTAVFTPDQGFLLNGKPIKIQGTCNHQDHAGVGVAIPDALYMFRARMLRRMGSNAVRTAHNMPAPAWVEACDRIGLMMMCETRQMGSTPDALAQLEQMVKRYRNSPSVILWSIGNEEEQLQKPMAEQGAAIAATMVRCVRALDPTRQVSAAVNGNNEQGLSDALDVIGFNYQLPRPDEFHRKFPNRPLYGSETGGVICTRGEYSSHPLGHTANAYDVKPDSWDESAEEWWTFYGTRPWQAGGFVWTGFDYRGEPAPYAWPTVNAQMGAMDLCGFPKDIFFYYHSWWQTEPVLHLLPHWNFEGHEGDMLTARAYSNLETVELFVNGKSQGKKPVPQLGHVDWQVRYEPGALEAVGYKSGKPILTARRETTGPIAGLRLSSDRMIIDANGEDLALLTVEAIDDKGRAIPTANHSVHVTMTGPGKLIGCGNGDPSCQESDRGPKRNLFNGLAQFILQADKNSGEIRIEAMLSEKEHLHVASATLLLTARSAVQRPMVS